MMLKERIQNDLELALKEGNQDITQGLKLVMDVIKNNEKEGDSIYEY